MDRLEGHRAAAGGLTRHRWVALSLVVALGAAAIGVAGDRSGLDSTTRNALPIRSDAETLALVERLERASLTPAELRFEAGYPRGFVGRVRAAGDTPAAQARAFLAEHAELYGLTDPAITLDVRRQAAIAGAARVVTFSERYRGLPVHGGELAVQIVGGDVVSVVGALVHGYDGVIVPAYGPADADRLARLAVKADAADIVGRTTLVLIDRSLWTGGPAAPRLAWRVAVGRPFSGLVFMNAKTGGLESAEPFAQDDSDPFDTMDLDLEDAENDSSAELDGCYWESDESEVGDEDGIDSDYANDLDAYHAWKYSRDAYAFYHNAFGLHGWDGDDDEINVYIRALVDNGRYEECDDGANMMEFKENYLAYDVMVHEYTHGVISFTSELGANWPSSSLNEGLADIMAAYADGDWLQGEDVPAKYLGGWPANRSLSTRRASRTTPIAGPSGRPASTRTPASRARPPGC